MKIKSIQLRRLHLPMKEPFRTSFGVESEKDVILVEVQTEAGAVGFSECVTSSEPLYSEETNGTAWHMIRDFFAPKVLDTEFHTPAELLTVGDKLHSFKGNRMAKAAVEMALWDAYANETQIPLHQLIGGEKTEIAVGISVGIQPTTDALVKKVNGYLQQGFQRIKVKVKPGYDLEPLAALRREFGDIPLMVDANSAYRLKDLSHLREFDGFGLMMMEQPLANDDLVDHARLQKELQTPICLDESIHSAEDARKAIELGACRIINVKVGRIGGFAEALRIHGVCQDAGIPLWCGGMLETGIGRLHNVALTTLPGFTLPGDTAPSARYFEQDLIEPEVVFSRPGFLPVEDVLGVASRLRMERVEKWQVDAETVNK
ncbi:o-succinylbenzoate synthase [Alicyclobacillaceae bacterium I2511]|jgi:O-succinylbenzoate synthase|nr:o-succinylbenzoate synthase [Alicyclobacillaceae bacterium I2511]